MISVYKIDKKKLKFPRECYSNWFNRLLGIQSPSCVVRVVLGEYGKEIRDKYNAARYENIKYRVNNRTASRAMWHTLHSWERLHGGWRGLDEY